RVSYVNFARSTEGETYRDQAPAIRLRCSRRAVPQQTESPFDHLVGVRNLGHLSNEAARVAPVSSLTLFYVRDRCARPCRLGEQIKRHIVIVADRRKG